MKPFSIISAALVAATLLSGGIVAGMLMVGRDAQWAMREDATYAGVQIGAANVSDRYFNACTEELENAVLVEAECASRLNRCISIVKGR